MKSADQVQNVVHLKLATATLCIECDAVFDGTDVNSCPACTNGVLVLLSTLLRPTIPGAIVRYRQSA